MGRPRYVEGGRRIEILPGCASQGQSEQEALENIRDAIREYLNVAEEFATEGDKREVVLQR